MHSFSQSLMSDNNKNRPWTCLPDTHTHRAHRALSLSALSYTPYGGRSLRLTPRVRTGGQGDGSSGRFCSTTEDCSLTFTPRTDLSRTLKTGKNGATTTTSPLSRALLSRPTQSKPCGSRNSIMNKQTLDYKAFLSMISLFGIIISYFWGFVILLYTVQNTWHALFPSSPSPTRLGLGREWLPRLAPPPRRISAQHDRAR